MQPKQSPDEVVKVRLSMSYTYSVKGQGTTFWNESSIKCFLWILKRVQNKDTLHLFTLFSIYTVIILFIGIAAWYQWAY